MPNSIFLSDFKSILPPIKLAQDRSRELMVEAYCQEFRKNKSNKLSNKLIADQPPGDAEVFARINKLSQRYGVDSSKIGHRHFESIEQGMQNSGMDERQSFFSKRAVEIFRALYNLESNEAKSADPKPSHIIHVTCTGYVSPSAPQVLVSQQAWTNTSISHAYHMGCYAALPAIRLASGLVSSSLSPMESDSLCRQVDVVHTEMCGLHFDPSDYRPEQMVVQSLFADGSIRYRIKKRVLEKESGLAAPASQIQNPAFQILNIAEKIIPDSLADMTWAPSEKSMKMTLSREVPSKIAAHLSEFLIELIGKSGLDFKQTMSEAVFAVHPGGPKIIQRVQELLNLSAQQIEISQQVLFERGNMSSATLPHIWQKILEKERHSG